jgi:hypothetical protein
VPQNAPSGFGDPSKFVSDNTVEMGPAGVGDGTRPHIGNAGTLHDLIESIALNRIGPVYDFTFSTSVAQPNSYVNWFPNQPGCDLAGESSASDPQFGYSEIYLTFGVYQAAP